MRQLVHIPQAIPPRFTGTIIALAFAIASVVYFVSCGGGSNDSGRVVNVTGVSLDRYAIEIGVNEEARLVAMVIPSNATNQSVAWSSDNTGVANVTNGRVTGMAVGSARVTATTENGGYKAHCDVYVRNIPVQGVYLDKASVTLIVGDIDTLTPIFQPANASNKNVTWNSSNPNIARVEGNGIVRAMAPGTATITVTTQDGGRTATCAVGVLSEAEAVRVTGVTLNKTSLTLGVGSSETIYATVQPSNATNRSVSWASSNPGVATVAGGTVTAVSQGGTTITVITSDGGRTATCAVTVVAAIVPVTGVTLNKTSLTLSVGNIETLVATVQPSNATNRSVLWSSSNENAATVNGNGLVTAVSPGSAAITVTTQDGGRTATCNVTVPAPPADVYVVGAAGLGSDSRATLWKNGVAQTLSSNPSTCAYGIFVSGTDVYVAGEGGYSDYRATLWKNGVAQTLSSSASYAFSVFVSGNDVYVAGDVSGRATLWKNGVAQTLSGSTSYANAVFVSGGDVYVVGGVGDYYDNATLWKNGFTQSLTSSTSSAYGVYVSGNDVYVAGNVGSNSSKATLWKNGVAQTLPGGQSNAFCVFVSGNDVYATGRDTNYDNGLYYWARLWKNGVAQTLSNTPGWGYGVFAYGNDVYVAGRQGDAATLWKNGASMTLTPSGSAFSVFVK